jgi:hypothetical protein
MDDTDGNLFYIHLLIIHKKDFKFSKDSNYLFIADGIFSNLQKRINNNIKILGFGGLKIFDIYDIKNPILVGILQTGYSAETVNLLNNDKTVIVANRNYGITIVNATDYFNP